MIWYLSAYIKINIIIKLTLFLLFGRTRWLEDLQSAPTTTHVARGALACHWHSLLEADRRPSEGVVACSPAAAETVGTSTCHRCCLPPASRLASACFRVVERQRASARSLQWKEREREWERGWPRRTDALRTPRPCKTHHAPLAYIRTLGAGCVSCCLSRINFKHANNGASAGADWREFAPSKGKSRGSQIKLIVRKRNLCNEIFWAA